MTEVLDVITRLSYIAEDEGIKKASDLILKQTAAIEKLAYERVALGEKQKTIAANDIAAQKKIYLEIKRVEDAIRSRTKVVINERLANSDLNKELQKEIGLLANIGLKLDALKTKKAMAQTAGEVRQVNREIQKLESQLASLNAKSAGAGGVFAQLLGGVGLGAGTLGFAAIFQQLSGFYNDSIREAAASEQGLLRFQQTLINLGKGQYFDELVQNADDLAKRYKNLYDNDDILAGQAKFIEGTKVTNQQLHELIPVAVELAAKLGTDVVTASEMLTNAIIGRTSPELKRLGLNMKGLGTDTERVNEITGAFANLLTGSVDTALQTAQGSTQQLRQELKNLEEDLGRALLPIQKKLTQLQVAALTTGNYLFGGADAQERIRAEAINKQQNFDKQEVNALLILNEKKQKLLKEGKYSEEKIEADFQKRLADMEQERVRSYEGSKSTGAFGMNKNFEETATQRARLEAFRRAAAQYKQLQNGDEIFNKNAGLDDPVKVEKAEKAVAKVRLKTAKELADQFRTQTDKEFSENLKLREDYNEKQLFLIEQLYRTGAITDEEYKDLELERSAAFYAEQVTFYEDYGKDVYKIKAELYKKLDELDKRQRERSKAELAKEKPITGEFLPGTTGDIEVGTKSVFTKEGEQEAINRGKSMVEMNQTLADSFSDVNTVIQAVGDSINSITDIQIKSIDREIKAQESRIDRAKKYAERGGAELLEIEEERLAQLEEKREKFARRQLVINNALALSNAIVAVATAAGETGVGAVVAIPAVLAAIAAGYALVTSLTEPQYFSEGEKYVDGPGTSKSDSIPAMLSKGERVVDAQRSGKFKAILDDIQDDRFRDQGDLINQIATGMYGVPMDYKGIMESKNTSSSALDSKLLVDISRHLMAVQEAIEEKPVPYMTADENGLNLFFSRLQQRALKQSKY